MVSINYRDYSSMAYDSYKEPIYDLVGIKDPSRKCLLRMVLYGLNFH